MLYWIPPAAALVLGLRFLWDGDPRAGTKLLVAGLLGVAQYLQFYGRGGAAWLAGLLINVLLAIVLSLWLKLQNVK